jgi:2-oxoglutarate/2-oxoacid ferredoxin oxidoreductase subunit alpha
MSTSTLNNFSLSIATVNGSGSQSANNILSKALFRMGLHVGAKNLFPSNISGLATWFAIRVSPNAHTGRRNLHEICVAKNIETLLEDQKSVKPKGVFFYDQEFKINTDLLRKDIQCKALPFRELSQPLSDSIKMRKMLTNMIYVGVLAELLDIDFEILSSVVTDQFKDKNQVIEINLKAIEAGQNYAKQHLAPSSFAYKTKKLTHDKSKLLIDGNTAAALGAIAGGCTFLSWYPITPSSSLAEGMIDYAKEIRHTETQTQARTNFASLQAEDELSAINMVIGAGWAGARAMTATSGPGLSLMAEAAGISYFAEIPAVIWDVQRAGPSTGLPTRTQQCDVRFAANLSHGDTEHIVLLPANPNECFEFARTAFDLAEKIQTLVIVLSDLDLGMNFHTSNDFSLNEKPFDRGKVLSAEQLNSMTEFSRYKDVDGDGICYRTLPGTAHAKAAYFARGTGHTEQATYSESPENYRLLLDRLKKKFETAKKYLPAIIVKSSAKTSSSVGLIAYGSTDLIMAEVQDSLAAADIHSDYLRVRSLPLSEDIENFLKTHSHIFILEQNRDAQMRNLLTQKFPTHAHKFASVLSYDGLPMAPESVVKQIHEAYNEK